MDASCWERHNHVAETVDLTADSDDEDERTASFSALSIAPRAIVPQSDSKRASTPSTPTNLHVPRSTKAPQYPLLVPPSIGQNDVMSSANSSCPPSVAPRAHATMYISPYAPVSDMNGSERTSKRRKLSTIEGQADVRGAPLSQPAYANLAPRPTSGLAVHAEPSHTSSRLVGKGMLSNTANKATSVKNMNALLKSNGTTTSLLQTAEDRGPRPLHIARISHASSSETLQSTSASPRKAAAAHADPALPLHHTVQGGYYLDGDGGNEKQGLPTQHVSGTQTKHHQDAEPVATFPLLSREAPIASYFSGTISIEDDKDSVVSDVSMKSFHAEPARLTPNAINNQQAVSTLASTPSAGQQSARSKKKGQFSEEEEHLLIFLKEVKKFEWKKITTEFQKHYPHRTYTTLQLRYSSKINRRDRSQDPATLKLPMSWAKEACIDGVSVYADNSEPRGSIQEADLQRSAPRPMAVRDTVEHEYSSRTDAGRQRRPRRGPPVDYDVRKRRHQALAIDAAKTDEVFQDVSAASDTPMSLSPCNDLEVLPKAHVVINSPLEVDFDSLDAGIALQADHWSHHPSTQKLPYLSTSQRIALQGPLGDWEWDQLVSRKWQGMLFHVDFSPSELDHVERAVAKFCTLPSPRHNTQRRQLRTMVKSLTEPKLHQLAHGLKSSLPARDSNSIASFLDDARRGHIKDSPQIMRLAAARPQTSTRTVRVDAISSMLRQREMGLRSRRGWQAASTAVTYQVKNKVMDTLGPLAVWTGASSDILTVAWSPDGERFAAGAVAVTDADSMQYNRANNLLFGSLSDNTIHELAEHTTKRERTESGANSSHAMFASQDPKLYTTVTSVAFAKSGKLMYSAGYDQSVCVWYLDPGSSQPSLASKFRHKAEVEMMVVNHKHAGMLATAARRTTGAAVKLITLDEDDPSEMKKHNYHSSKAASRSDLRILPQALQFEPRHGNHLLAGFGANMQEDSVFDTNGDLCLWDINADTLLQIHGSSRNVFDVAFNPNRRSMPFFAAGCVAGGNVNRGTRSIIRLYDERRRDYACSLEIECRALDMNDVVWCPQNEELIAAGCTDGRVYVWDLRNPDDPLRILSHGRSTMPLQEDVHPERTDTGVRFLCWGENATRLYSGSSDGVVKLWDVTRSEMDTFVKDVIAVDSGIMAGAFSPDYSKLVLGEVNGSVNVLDVGRDDCTVKDTERLHYIPYAGIEYENDSVTSGTDSVFANESGVAEGSHLLLSKQLQLAPMGNLPIRQVVQGPNYSGPFDKGIDAPYLRTQAREFQRSLEAQPGPQCNLDNCNNSIVKVTSEESGDSGRSTDRIPHELQKQRHTIPHMVPGKSKCTQCNQPARPRPSVQETPTAPPVVLCERCSFACFRCNALNHIPPPTTCFTCKHCSAVWEIGTLGYQCLTPPSRNTFVDLDVPPLKRYARAILEDALQDDDTRYADDQVNALSDYYFSLAIDRPESPCL